MLIGIVGMGYVGLTLAISLASKGLHVIGLEVDEEKVTTIQSGKLPFYENNMEPMLMKAISEGYLKITSLPSDLKEISHCFITVGTPLVNGINDTSQIKLVVNEIAPVVHEGSIICLRSTVALGTTRVIQELLLQFGHSGKIAFCPERTVEGNALSELSSLPQIIGAEDPIVAEACMQVFKILKVKAIVTDCFEVAELAKLSCNAWRDLYFAFANEIALIGEDQKVNSLEALKIAQLDYPRFQAARPGPVGGPCLVKDGKTLANSSLRRETIGSLFDTSRAINNEVINWAVEKIELVKNDLNINKIGILGLAFKSFPLTDDMRCSPSLDIISRAIIKWPQLLIDTWDPLVKLPQFKDSLHDKNVSLNADLHNILFTNNIIIVCHKLMPEYNLIVQKHLSECDKKIIIDLSGNFSLEDIKRHTYLSFGTGVY